MAKRLARPKPDYDMDRDGNNDYSLPGNYVLSSHFRTSMTVPRYNEGPLVFRPWPALDYEDPETRLQIGREREETQKFTHWMVQIRAASYIGMDGGERCTFLLYSPIAENAKELKNSNPYLQFYQATKRANAGARFANNKKWDTDWNKLFIGKQGEGKGIKADVALYFIQGQIYANGKRNYMDKDRDKPFGLLAKDPLAILQLPNSAGAQIKEVFRVEKEEYEGDVTDNPSLPYVNGDPVGKHLPKRGVVSGGKIFRIINPEITSLAAASNNSIGLGSGGGNFTGYEVEVLDEYVANRTTYTPRLEADDVKTVLQKSQFWFDSPDGKDKGLLHFPSEEEQMVYIAKAFKPAPKLVYWAMCEREELFTDDVKAVLAHRLTVPGSVSTNPPDDDDDDDEDDDEQYESLPHSNKKMDPMMAKMAKMAAKKVAVVDDNDDEEDDDTPPAKKKKAKVTPPDDDDNDDEEDDDTPPAKKKKGKVTPPEEDDEEDDDDDTPPAKKKKGKVAPPEEDDEEDDDDDTPPVKKKKGKVAPPEEDDDEDDEEDDDDDDTPPVKKKKGKVAPPEEDDDEEDDDDTPPVKKKKDKVAPPEKDDDEEDEEDEEDDDDEEEVAPAPPKKRGRPKTKKDDEDDAKVKQSLDAASGRAKKRSTPEVSPPVPPSKGGKAKKK